MQIHRCIPLGPSGRRAYFRTMFERAVRSMLKGLTLLAHLTCTLEPHLRQVDPGLVMPQIEDYRRLKSACISYYRKDRRHVPCNTRKALEWQTKRS